MTKKKATKATAKKAATKKKPAALPEFEGREFGDLVHTWRAPRDHAIEWIREFGYRVADDQGERVIIEGDAVAHGRMMASHGRDSDDDAGPGDD